MGPAGTRPRRCGRYNPRMEPVEWMAIAAWGSFGAAFTSACVAAASFIAYRRSENRAQVSGSVVEVTGKNTPQANVDLRLWNEGPGEARDIALSMYPGPVPDESIDDLILEHSPLPESLGPGDQIPVNADVALPQHMNTLRITWKDRGSRKTRQRFLIVGDGD